MGLVRVPDGRIFPATCGRSASPSLLPNSPLLAVVGASPRRRARTGLLAGTPVVTGWIDSYCSMLGTGMGDQPMGFDVAGTSEVIGVVTDARARRAIPRRAGHPLDAEIARRLWAHERAPTRSPGRGGRRRGGGYPQC
jgi:hypothetical protein